MGMSETCGSMMDTPPKPVSGLPSKKVSIKGFIGGKATLGNPEKRMVSNLRSGGSKSLPTRGI